MDRSKYISSDEKKVLDENIKSQVLNLKKNLSDKSKFKLKEEITNFAHNIVIDMLFQLDEKNTLKK